MKNAFCYMVLLVLVMSVMVSCEEKATYTIAEAVEPQVQPATDTIEEQQEDTLSPLYAFDSIDESQVYVPYLVFLSLAGRPVMAYEHSNGNLYLYALSIERYEKIMSGEWIPFIDQLLAPS